MTCALGKCHFSDKSLTLQKELGIPFFPKSGDRLVWQPLWLVTARVVTLYVANINSQIKVAAGFPARRLSTKTLKLFQFQTRLCSPTIAKDLALGLKRFI